MSKIDLKESFDVEVERREVQKSPKMTADQEGILIANKIAISGHTSIDHKDSKGNTVDFEEGSNLIVTAGKKGIVNFIIGTLNSGDGTNTSVADFRRFDRIALGRGGGTSVASTDLCLNNELDLLTGSDHTNTADWKVDTSINGTPDISSPGNSANFDFCSDATFAVSGNPNATGNYFSRELICDYHASAPSDVDFYMTTEDSGLTAVWYAKFTISNLSTYWTSGTPSIIINEAGIVNQAGITENGSGDNYLLARRTFTNKQVKTADTLTITWKITIK